jgi:hypothetical protein
MDAGSRESLASYESLTSINNSILRRHFFELTAEFLLPLRKYYTPRERNSEKSNPYLHPPEIPAFKEAIFLGEVGDVVLNTRSPSVASSSSEQPYHYPLLHACGLKSATLGTLYAKFVRSPHFYPWLNSKRELAQVCFNRLFRIGSFGVLIVFFVSSRAVGSRPCHRISTSIHRCKGAVESHARASSSRHARCRASSFGARNFIRQR